MSVDIIGSFRMSVSRIYSFDSLRFLAALVVLYSHAASIFPGSLIQTIGSWGVMNSKSAVAFFFVLSGLVLHLSWRGEAPRLGCLSKFMVRRVFRIYPIYYVSIAMSLLCLLLPLSSVPELVADEVAGQVVTRDHADVYQWLQHVVLVTPGLDFNFLNPPIWTLSAEMRVAFLFPFIAFLMSRLSMLWGAVVLSAAVMFAPILSTWTVPTVAILPLFMFGAWLAQHRVALSSRSLSVWWLALVVGAIGYAFSASLVKVLEIPKSASLYPAGAFGGIVLLAVHNLQRVSSMLESWVPRGLADVSFGVYALHFPILLGVAWLYSRLGWQTWTYVPMCVALTIGVARIAFQVVEQPLIRAGRRLSDRFETQKVD